MCALSLSSSSSSSSSTSSSSAVSFCGAEDLSSYFHISKKVQKILPVHNPAHTNSTNANFEHNFSNASTSSTAVSSSSSTSSLSLPLISTFAGDVDYLPGPSVFSFPRIRLPELSEAKMKINCEKDSTIQRILELHKIQPTPIRVDELTWIQRIEHFSNTNANNSAPSAATSSASVSSASNPTSSASASASMPLGAFRFRSDTSDLSATLSNLLPKFELEYNGIQQARDRLRNNDQAKAIKRRKLENAHSIITTK